MFEAKCDQEPYTKENKQKSAVEVTNLLQAFSRAMIRGEQQRLPDCVGKLVLYNDNGTGAWQTHGFSPPPMNHTKSNEIEKHCEKVVHDLESILSQIDVENKLFMDVWCNAESLLQIRLLAKDWR
jgi:hypothetical protein